MDTDLGIFIRNARLDKNYTQKELAEMCKISSQTIRKIETGKRRPKLFTITLIFSVLDINLNENLAKFGYKTQSDNIYLGIFIRNARLDKNYTRKELADKCNISSQTIIKIETGKKRPTLFTITLIFSVLNINLGQTLRKFGYISDLDNTSLGNFVRNSRFNKGYYQQDLANLSGLSLLSIQLIETGKIKKPRLSTFKSICSALNIDLNETLLEKFGYITKSNILGDFIRNSRSFKGYSRQDLANLSGLSSEAIYLIETGKRKPRISTIKLISSALDIDYSKVLEKI